MNTKETLLRLTVCSALVALSACGSGGDDAPAEAPAPSPSAPAPSPSPTPPGDTALLPPALLAQPAAANCATLRSGTYRAFYPYFSSLEDQTSTVTIDAAALTFTDGDGTTGALTANGDCRYTTTESGQTEDLVVSPAGVIVARVYDDAGPGPYRLLLLLPQQQHAVDELAGTWNALAVERENDDATSAANAVYGGGAGTVTMDASGHATSVTWCQNIVDCELETEAAPVFTARSDGGFDVTEADSSSRAYLYQSAGGALLLIYDGDGSFILLTKQRTNTLPNAGAPGTASWGLWANTSLASTAAVSEDGPFPVVSVDAAAGSYLRSAPDGHQETVFVNSPRDGYNHRPAASATNSQGGAVNVREWYALGLAGMGMSALWFPTLGLSSAPGAVYFSVTRP